MNELLGHKVIGLDSVTNVASGAIFTLIVNPQVPFKVERLLVPIGIAPFFQITDIFVGKKYQGIASHPAGIPAEVFAVRDEIKYGKITGEMIRGERFDMDVCIPGYSLSVTVVNIDIVRRRFMGGLAGREVSCG